MIGICKDPWAGANRIKVEGTKIGKHKGTYLQPQLHGNHASWSAHPKPEPPRAPSIEK